MLGRGAPSLDLQLRLRAERVALRGPPYAEIPTGLGADIGAGATATRHAMLQPMRPGARAVHARSPHREGSELARVVR